MLCDLSNDCVILRVLPLTNTLLHVSTHLLMFMHSFSPLLGLNIESGLFWKAFCYLIIF